MARADGMDLMYSFEDQGQKALSGLSGLESSFAGINTANDVQNRYGLKKTEDVYAPLFKMLEAQKAKRMRGATLRAGRSASPGMTFSDIEYDSENSFQNLLSGKAQSDVDQQKFVASLLGNAQAGNNQFGLNKFGQMGQQASSLFNNRLNLEQFNRAGEAPGFGDIAMSIFGAAAPVAGAWLGRPQNTFSFSTDNPGKQVKNMGMTA